VANLDLYGAFLGICFGGLLKHVVGEPIGNNAERTRQRDSLKDVCVMGVQSREATRLRIDIRCGCLLRVRLGLVDF